MNIKIVGILILITPFVMMIMVNEYVRGSSNSSYHVYGSVAINSSQFDRNKCSWSCHNNTALCKKYHVKFLKPYFNYVDPIYFGIINNLKSTSQYKIANIILFVILIPIMIFILTMKNIQLYFKKKNN